MLAALVLASVGVVLLVMAGSNWNPKHAYWAAILYLSACIVLIALEYHRLGTRVFTDSMTLLGVAIFLASAAGAILVGRINRYFQCGKKR